MAKLTPEAERYAALQSAGLSSPVLRLAQGEAASVHPVFANWCELPWYGFFANRQGKTPEIIPWGGVGDTVLPLWGFGESVTVCRTASNGERDFAELNIEDSRHALFSIAKSEQGLLADVMITVIESLDWESSEAWDGDARQTVEDAARAVDFHYLTETFAFLDSVSGENYENEKRAFTRSL